MIELFDGGKERVHVEVKNPSLGRAIHVVHDTTDLADRRCSPTRSHPIFGHRHHLSGALVARREKMNKRELEKAIAEVAERLELYLDEQVDARIVAEAEQKQG
jgi:hypothetical protein